MIRSETPLGRPAIEGARDPQPSDLALRSTPDTVTLTFAMTDSCSNTAKATSAQADRDPDLRLLDRAREQIGRVVVGQGHLVDDLLLALLCSGHVLIEGIPGLAKTLVVSTLAQTLDTSFNRIQFTPDLLPGDLVGTLVFNPKDGGFTTQKGPIFANILLADEINRSPAKVQSALLEAMQEKQVTIGDETYPLEEPFLVLATQNPIEQEGTYTLPEAQLDRFIFKTVVTYPTLEEEREVMRRMSKSTPNLAVEGVLSKPDILRMRSRLDDILLKENLEDYILRLVEASRDPDKHGIELGPQIRHGASPRATIFLARAARAHAFLEGRDFTTPTDVKAIAPQVLRHRIATTYQAEARGISSDQIVEEVLGTVAIS